MRSRAVCQIRHIFVHTALWFVCILYDLLSIFGMNSQYLSEWFLLQFRNRRQTSNAKIFWFFFQILLIHDHTVTAVARISTKVELFYLFSGFRDAKKLHRMMTVFSSVFFSSHFGSNSHNKSFSLDFNACFVLCGCSLLFWPKIYTFRKKTLTKCFIDQG